MTRRKTMLGSDEQLGEAHSRPAGFSASGRGRTDKVLMGWNKDCFESQRVFQTNLATNFLTGIEILGRPINLSATQKSILLLQPLRPLQAETSSPLYVSHSRGN